MDADTLSFASKVVAFLLGSVVSVAGTVFTIGRKLGSYEKARESEAHENGVAHSTLDGKIRSVSADLLDVRKSAVRAHERIDVHAVKIGMLESNGQSLKERMDSGFSEVAARFAEVNTSLHELRGAVNAVLLAIKKG